MARLTKISFLLFVLIGFFFLPVFSVFALELEYPDWFLKETRQKIEAGQMDVLGVLIFDLFNVFLVIAGVAAFVMLIVGGVRYLTSFGNPSVMADAKNRIFSALLGLGLLLASYLILTTINPQLVELKEPGLKPIKPVVVLPPGEIQVNIKKPITGTLSLNLGKAPQTKDLVAASPTSPAPLAVILTVDPQAGKMTITGIKETWDKILEPETFKDELTKKDDDSKIAVEIEVIMGSSPAKGTGVAVIFKGSFAGYAGYTENALLFEDTLFSKDSYPVKFKGLTIAYLEIDPDKNTMKLMDPLKIKTLASTTLKDGATISTTINVPGLGDDVTVGITLHFGVVGMCQAGTFYDVELYKDRGYKERIRCFNSSEKKEWSAATEDIYAVKIKDPAITAVRFYQNFNYKDRQICFKNNYPNLKDCMLDDRLWPLPNDNWEDSINSLEVISAAECATPNRTLDDKGQPTDDDDEKCK